MSFRVELIRELLTVSRRKYCSEYGSRTSDTCVVWVCIHCNWSVPGRCHPCVREKESHDQNTLCMHVLFVKLDYVKLIVLHVTSKAKTERLCPIV